MKKLAPLMILLAAFWCQSTYAEEFEDFGRQTSYFYLNPSRESFEKFQQQAESFREKLDSLGNGASVLVAVMIARISEAHDWPITEGVFGDRAREILEGKSRFAMYVGDDSQVDPTKLDIWWASFFATGDGEYLDKILEYAGLDLPESDVASILVIGAATWSFKSNCRQHQRVLEYAKSRLRRGGLPESQMRFLRECIEGAGDEGSANAG